MNSNIAAIEQAFGKLYSIVQKLRAPDGCPWDREQTPETIRGNLIEEAYELVEAINEGNPEHIQEELGDMFLLPVMFAVMYDEEGAIQTTQVLNGITEKIIRRHPHVFGDAEANTPDEVVKQWNAIKVSQEGKREKTSMLDTVKRGLPPLERAYKIQQAAAKAGFDWQSADRAWEKMFEELSEAREACIKLECDTKNGNENNQAQLEEELGDLLFSLINVARKHHVDPSLALQRTIDKFSYRFHYVEQRMKEKGIPMEQSNLHIMDQFWEEAKH